MTDEQPTTPAGEQPNLPGVEIAVAAITDHPSGIPVVMARFTLPADAVEVHIKDGQAIVFIPVDARQAVSFAQALGGGIMQGARVALAAKPQIVVPGQPGFAVPGGVGEQNMHDVLRQRNGRRPA